MEQTSILLPVLAQIILTIAILGILGARRATAYKTGKINKRQAMLDQRAWPDEVIKATNNFNNQFEMPILFYVLCLALLIIKAVTLPVLVMAWIFVISRYVHMFIHIGSNYVPYRFAAFATGCLMLLGMIGVTGWHCLQLA